MKPPPAVTPEPTDAACRESTKKTLAQWFARRDELRAGRSAACDALKQHLEGA